MQFLGFRAAKIWRALKKIVKIPKKILAHSLICIWSKSVKKLIFCEVRQSQKGKQVEDFVPFEVPSSEMLVKHSKKRA